LEVLDISDCPFIGEDGFSKFLVASKTCARRIQASNCQDAITDDTVTKIANLESDKLHFLDISFAKKVTDEGLQAFKGKTFPLTHICLNGMTSVTGAGLYHPISACSSTV